MLHLPTYLLAVRDARTYDRGLEGAAGPQLALCRYHVDHPVAVERIGWYRQALRKNGRGVEGLEICCVYHAQFPESDEDESCSGRCTSR